MTNDSTGIKSAAATPDWFLQRLVGIIENSDMGVSLTLQVRGLFVSGRIASGAEYFEGVTKMFVDVCEGEAKTAAKEFASTFGTIHQETLSGGGPELPQFIHLKNVVVYTADSNNRAQFDWWRGRISEVDGFSFGCLPR